MAKVQRFLYSKEDPLKFDAMEKGLKYDTGKPDYSLVPPEVYKALAIIMTYGANKYEAENWRLVKPIERYYSALMRHLEDVRLYMKSKGKEGEWLDKESGYPHMWHVLTNAAFLTVLWGEEYENKNSEND